MAGLTVSVAAIKATRGRSTPRARATATVLFMISIRRARLGATRDAGVGHQEPPPGGVDVHQHDLADHPSGTEPAGRVEHRTEQRRGRDPPLHQQHRPPLPDLGHRRRRDRVPLRGNDRESVQADPARLGRRADRRLGPDHDRFDPVVIDRDAQRLQDRRVVAPRHRHGDRLAPRVGVPEESGETRQAHASLLGTIA